MTINEIQTIRSQKRAKVANILKDFEARAWAIQHAIQHGRPIKLVGLESNARITLVGLNQLDSLAQAKFADAWMLQESAALLALDGARGVITNDGLCAWTVTLTPAGDRIHACYGTFWFSIPSLGNQEAGAGVSLATTALAERVLGNLIPGELAELAEYLKAVVAQEQADACVF